MGNAHLNVRAQSYKNAIAQLNQEKPLIKFIGQVQLRNSRRVYYLEDFYRVEQVNPNREQVNYSYDIPDKVVEYLYNQLKGRKVTKKGFFLTYYAKSIAKLLKISEQIYIKVNQILVKLDI